MRNHLTRTTPLLEDRIDLSVIGKIAGLGFAQALSDCLDMPMRRRDDIFVTGFGRRRHGGTRLGYHENLQTT